MKSYFVLIVLNILATQALASGAQHEGGVPVNTIIFQAINLGIIVAGMFYYLKKPVKQYFVEKNKSFIQAAEKSQAARKQAEEEHLQIKVQLSRLESTADESLSRAKAEAADYKKQLLAEAEVISKRISDEAAAAARLEVEKAKNQLRAQMIKEATEQARGQMQNQVSASDHQRLQGEFINNIQAAQK